MSGFAPKPPCDREDRRRRDTAAAAAPGLRQAALNLRQEPFEGPERPETRPPRSPSAEGLRCVESLQVTGVI